MLADSKVPSECPKREADSQSRDPLSLSLVLGQWQHSDTFGNLGSERIRFAPIVGGLLSVFNMAGKQRVLDTHIHLAENWKDGLDGLKNVWLPEMPPSFQNLKWTEVGRLSASPTTRCHVHCSSYCVLELNLDCGLVRCRRH